SDLYLNRQPSPKAEAMGNGLVANSDGDFGSFYNPALTSLTIGTNFNSSYSEPKTGKSSFNFIGLSYTNEKSGSFGISRYYWGKDDKTYRDYGVNGKVYNAIYRINYSREVVKDFFAGINAGVYHISYYPDAFIGIRVGTEYEYSVHDDGVTLDFGLLKKFTFENNLNKNLSQILQLGSSIYNLTGSKVHYVNADPVEEPLPVIFRIGGSYSLKINDGEIKTSKEMISSFTHVEFEKVLNSDYDAVYKIGEEILLYEIIALRAGYYYTKIRDEIGDSYYWDIMPKSQSDFTLGVGFQIPINKIFKFTAPLTLKIDYASMEPGYTRYPSSLDKFFTLALNINYSPL
ncbi:MAG: hypothetical protein J0M18_20475, partial [Ignavibacteria bacterium]|nr:hypothetical protein [Ignavibacteria bacterium]